MNFNGFGVLDDWQFDKVLESLRQDGVLTNVEAVTKPSDGNGFAEFKADFMHDSSHLEARICYKYHAWMATVDGHPMYCFAYEGISLLVKQVKELETIWFG